MLDFQRVAAQYQETLLGRIVPFWLKHSRDPVCGGYFDGLDADGQPIDGDKSITQQARQVWAFAWLYANVQDTPAWLAHAQHGADFLAQCAHDEHLNAYAVVDRRGRPVATATNLIPDSSVAMGYAQMYRATGNDEWAMLAKQTLTNLLGRRAAARQQTHALGSIRPLKHLSEPVALLKTLVDLKELLDEQAWKDTIDSVKTELLTEFLDRRLDLLRETVGPEGTFYNTPEGRRLSPGLAFEAAGYLFDLSRQTGDQKLALRVVGWVLRFCEAAWDDIGGGLVRWIDLKDELTIFPEASQRWASVHLEGIAALSKGYYQTRHPDCPRWIKRIHDYTFQFFPDPKHPAWHLVLDRTAKPLLMAKATPTDGCFQFIKCMADAWQTLDKCGQLQPAGKRIKTGL
ncbi:MAG: AGE family epimerase/isomerase [Bacteroidetes bacterium]|nr:AGE family epimerase/isomerase [Fibrella sp.]